MWYYNKQCYLFVHEGVFLKPDRFSPRFFKTILWTLVDSNESWEGVPEDLITHGTRLFVIYTTSPCQKGWDRLHKTVRDITIIMNPWTKKEILRG